MHRIGLLVVALALVGPARADEVDPYAGWGPKLDQVLAQVPTGRDDATRLLGVIDAAQRDPDPVGAFVRGLAAIDGDLRVTGADLTAMLLRLGLQNEQLAADREAAGLPPGPPAPPIAMQLARSLTGITKLGPSIVIDRAGGPLLVPLPGGRQARLGERIAFSAQRGPEGEPVIGPAPVFEVHDGEERLKTYSDHGWIAGLEVVNADGKVSRAIRSLALRERRGTRVVELAVDAYGDRELFVRTPVTVGTIDRSKRPIPRGPSLQARALDRLKSGVAGLFSPGRPTTAAPTETVGIARLLTGAMSGDSTAPKPPAPKPPAPTPPAPTPPAPTPPAPTPPTPTPTEDDRRAEVVPDDDAVAVDDDAVAVADDDLADEAAGAGLTDPTPRPVGGDEDALEREDPRGSFLDPGAPDERDAVAVEEEGPSAPVRSPTSGAPRDDGTASPPRDLRAHPDGQRAQPGAAGGRPDPLASILQPLLQGLPRAQGGGGTRGPAGAPRGAPSDAGVAPAAASEDPALAATRAAVRALLRRALGQPRARRVDTLLDGLDPLVASRPPAHEPLIRQTIARAVLDRRFAGRR